MDKYVKSKVRIYGKKVEREKSQEKKFARFTPNPPLQKLTIF